MHAVRNKLLLSIVELGGYPNFTPLYQELGYEVAIETRMRKALIRACRVILGVIPDQTFDTIQAHTTACGTLKQGQITINAQDIECIAQHLVAEQG